MHTVYSFANVSQLKGFTSTRVVEHSPRDEAAGSNTHTAVVITGLL